LAHDNSGLDVCVLHAAQGGMQELVSGHQKVKWAHWEIAEGVRVKSLEEQTTHGPTQVFNCGHQV